MSGMLSQCDEVLLSKLCFQKELGLVYATKIESRFQFVPSILVEPGSLDRPMFFLLTRYRRVDLRPRLGCFRSSPACSCVRRSLNRHDFIFLTPTCWFVVVTAYRSFSYPDIEQDIQYISHTLVRRSLKSIIPRPPFIAQARISQTVFIIDHGLNPC